MQQQKQKTADVVIVGAGIAGLTAADHLHRSGVMDVVILEASNRFVFKIFFKTNIIWSLKCNVT